MLRRILLSLLILALGIGGFVYLKKTRPQPPLVETKERVWRVETLAVEPGDHRPALALFGRVEAPDRMRAAAPVAGRVLEVRVRDGERVIAGQLLARLDPRDLEPKLAQARAEVEKEQLKVRHDREALSQEREILRLAEVGVARADKVQAQKLGSESSVDLARELLARARLTVTLREQSIAEHPARLAVLQAKLAEAERDAGRGELTAPFAAHIGKVEAAAGDQVQANQTLLTLFPLDGLYLRAKIPAAQSRELRDALAAGTVLTAKGQFGGQPVVASLERISGEADARGVDALLRLAQPADIPLGAFLELQLERPAVAGTVALPFGALHGGNRVFLVAEGRLQGVEVERIGETLPIDGGGALALVRAPALQPGSKVMATHLPNAVEGLKVEEVR